MKANRSTPLPFSGLQPVRRPFDLPAENWRWSGSLPNCCNLRVALQGQAEMTARGKTYPLHARACFVFSPTQELSVRSEAPPPFRNFACRLLPVEGNGDRRREKVGRLMGPEAANFSELRDFGPPAWKTPLPRNRPPAFLLKASPKFGRRPTRRPRRAPEDGAEMVEFARKLFGAMWSTGLFPTTSGGFVVCSPITTTAKLARISILARWAIPHRQSPGPASSADGTPT